MYPNLCGSNWVKPFLVRNFLLFLTEFCELNGKKSALERENFKIN
jgi:hypothetical protein